MYTGLIGLYNIDFLILAIFQCEKSSASEVAIDKPSDSLIQFMGKHYDLKDPIWQTINFVVYASFFEHIEPCNQDLHKKQQQNLSSKVQYVEVLYDSLLYINRKACTSENFFLIPICFCF